MPLLNLIIMIIFGITAGVSTGLTGASGVLIIVPLIDIFLDYSIHMCIGISLIVDVVAPLAIAMIYSKYGNIDLRSGGWLAFGSIIGAQVGAILVTGIPSMGLGNLYGFVLIIMGFIMWRRGAHETQLDEDRNNYIDFNKNWHRIITVLLLGLLVGLMTGVLGAGGGLIFLVILVFVLQFPIHEAVGTSSMIMAITAFSGTLGYAFQGNIDFTAGLIIGLSATIVGSISAGFANRLDETMLNKIISLVFGVLGVVMILIRFL